MALDLKNQEMVLEIGSNLVGLTTQEMILEDLEDLLMHMQLISSVVEITIIPIILWMEIRMALKSSGLEVVETQVQAVFRNNNNNSILQVLEMA